MQQSVEPAEPESASAPRYVTIRISAETHRRLLEAGRMGDSFDSVIRRLLEHAAVKE